LLSEKISASAIQLQQNILNVMSNTVWAPWRFC
jgi:hypothetical protein